MARAQLDPGLGVRVISRRELRYRDVAPLGADRPAHVRAASGLAFVGGRLAVVQDDAAFIAYVAGDDVSAHALPRGANGRRRFEVGLGNKMEKVDLEACVTVGDELWAFGSGSASARDKSGAWIAAPSARSDDGALLAPDASPRDKIAVIGYATRMHDAAPLYRRIREELGGAINLEGVAAVGGELWLFHRGNTGAGDLGPAVARFDRIALARWLAGDGPVPAVMSSERYDLGSTAGSRLGFTDAIELGGRVFYLAAAEASDNAIDDGAVLASQLGVIAGDSVRACSLVLDGAPAKAEGLAFDPRDPAHAWVAIDPDDVDEPARLYELELVGAW